MRFAVITHRFDHRWKPGARLRMPWMRKNFMIDDVLGELVQRGHELFYISPGDRFRPADAAILHVDETVVDKQAADLAARYPYALNSRILDISKSAISQNLVERASDWPGPVIVKSNLNCAGAPERRHNRRAGRWFGPKQHDVAANALNYAIHERLDQVPEQVWDRPEFVVEKFLPERVGEAYGLRIWVRLGSYDRCNLYQSPNQIVKAATISRVGPVPVPEELRRQADALGVEFGKMDFVVHEWRPVLLDVNKTPGYTNSIRSFLEGEAPAMTDGFLDLVARNAR